MKRNIDLLILAAGRGSRMKKLTHNIPKFFLNINGRTILERQLSVYKNFNIDEMFIVTGYMNKAFENIKIKKFFNKYWDKTNMVFSIYCAKEILKKKNDLIIIYSDIIFHENVLFKIINSKFENVIIQDEQWKKLWSHRFEAPLLDAETLKLNKKNNSVLEIGKEPRSFLDIEGQYIGITKIGKTFKKGILKIFSSYIGSGRIFFNNKTIESCYMTDLLQYMINNNFKLNYETIKGGWYEFDTEKDYQIYSEDYLLQE